MIEKNYLFPNIIDLDEQSVIVDIETTGFSLYSDIICIGFIKYFNQKNLKITILISEKKSDEKELLENFINKSIGFKKIITYNGESFDIPRIENKLLKYNIDFSLNNIDSFDLYKYLSSLNKLLKFPSLKLKEIEKYLNIDRKEDFDYSKLKNYFENNTVYINNIIEHNYNDLANFVLVIDKVSQVVDKFSFRYKDITLKISHISEINDTLELSFVIKNDTNKILTDGNYFFPDNNNIIIKNKILNLSIILRYDSKNNLYYHISYSKIYPIIYKDNFIIENIFFILKEKINKILNT